jgi:hypothetical protein
MRETASPWRQSKVRLGHPIKLTLGIETPRCNDLPAGRSHDTPFHASRCAKRMRTHTANRIDPAYKNRIDPAYNAMTKIGLTNSAKPICLNVPSVFLLARN